jgi:N-acetyltransferase
MPSAVTLEGCRVKLEPLNLSHVSALVLAATEARDTYDFTRVPADDRAMTEYIEAALADQKTGGALPFAIYDLRRQAVVGSTRFLDLDYWSSPSAWPPGRSVPRPDATPTVAEIGSTWLAASAQRTSCNTEAKLLMLSHAFDTWGVLRVTLKTDSRNTRSRRAIERIGGRFEGIRRAHARAVDGSVRDSAYYSIVATEWPGVSAALKARLSELSAHRSWLLVRQPERELSRPLGHVGFHGGIGLVDLQAGAPPLPVRRLPDIPGQVVLIRPLQQVSGRAKQAIGMARVPDRRIPAGREHAGLHQVITIHDRPDRHPHLDLQAAVHIDHVVLPKGSPGR